MEAAILEPVAFIMREDGTAWQASLGPGSLEATLVRFRSSAEARAAIARRPDLPIVTIDPDHPGRLMIWR
jgi:hypothetical protein